jgi:hypothetical protein
MVVAGIVNPLDGLGIRNGSTGVDGAWGFGWGFSVVSSLMAYFLPHSFRCCIH